MKTKNKTFKIVLICGMMVLAALISACGLDSFATGDLTAVKNSLPSASAKKQTGSTSDWIEINKVTGHKWKLTYEHRAETATLDVAIVNWDEDRYELTDIIHECSFSIKGSNSGGRVEVPLNIKDAIEKCYSNAGIKKSVDQIEHYPGIQFEMSGSWNGPDNGVIVEHQSSKPFIYKANEYNGGRVALLLNAEGVRGGIKGESQKFNVGGGVPAFRAATNLDFWTSMLDNPTVSMSYLEHFIWDSSGKVAATAKSDMGSRNALSVDLGQTILVFDPPGDLELEFFVIDPKNYGSGNAG